MDIELDLKLLILCAYERGRSDGEAAVLKRHGRQPDPDVCDACGKRHKKERKLWVCPRCTELRCMNRCIPCLKEIHAE